MFASCGWYYSHVRPKIFFCGAIYKEREVKEEKGERERKRKRERAQ